jgi:hypothetical protein
LILNLKNESIQENYHHQQTWITKIYYQQHVITQLLAVDPTEISGKDQIQHQLQLPKQEKTLKKPRKDTSNRATKKQLQRKLPQRFLALNCSR